MESQSPQPKPSRAAQACIPCRARKVRCNGKQPCQGCSHTGIACNFIPRDSTSRSRARSKRGGILKTLRPEQSGPRGARPLASLAVQPQTSPPGGTAEIPSIDIEFLGNMLQDYLDSVYIVCPVLGKQAIVEAINGFGSSADHRALCYAYAAVTTALGPSSNPQKRPEVIAHMITLALRARPAIGHPRQITLGRVVFAVFLRITFGVLQDQDMDFFYLRESITMLQVMRPESSEIVQDPAAEQRAWQRLHWVVYIQERVACICHERTAILDPCPAEWGFWDEALPLHIRQSFERMIALYRLVDDTFLRNWREKQDGTSLTLEWVTERQKALALQQELVEELCDSVTELQKTDLVLTCQWLRTIVWQMAGSKYMLHSDASQDYMLLLFPVQGCVYVGKVLRKTSRESLNQQGGGNLQKLFEITNTAADVLSLLAKHPHKRDIFDWIDNCCFLIRWLQEFTQLHSTQRRILQEKLEGLELLTADLEKIA
ncbi:hypothetical protein CC79DRAFT_454849 [Sarocladium strictum]